MWCGALHSLRLITLGGALTSLSPGFSTWEVVVSIIFYLLWLLLGSGEITEARIPQDAPHLAMIPSMSAIAMNFNNSSYKGLHCIFFFKRRSLNLLASCTSELHHCLRECRSLFGRRNRVTPFNSWTHRGMKRSLLWIPRSFCTTQWEYGHFQVLRLVGDFHSYLFLKSVGWEFMLLKRRLLFPYQGTKHELFIYLTDPK